MTAIPLTSWSVTKEAFQLVWRHKKILSCFVILPVSILWIYWFLILGGIWFPVLEPYANMITDSKAILPLLFFVNTLWTWAWLKQILHPEEKIGFKSYFAFDTYFFLYAGYFFFLLCLVFAFLPSIIIMFPLTLILPALAYGKPFAWWNLMKQPIAFYGKLITSLIIGMTVALFLVVLFWNLGGIPLAWLEGSGPLPLDRSPSNEFWYLTLFFIAPLGMVLLQAIPLTIITLCYKKSILKA